MLYAQDWQRGTPSGRRAKWRRGCADERYANPDPASPLKAATAAAPCRLQAPAHRPRLSRIAVRGENIAGPASSPAAGARRVTAAIAVEPFNFPYRISASASRMRNSS